MKNLILIMLAVICAKLSAELPKPPGQEGKTIAQLNASLRKEIFPERKFNTLCLIARLYASEKLTKKNIVEAKKAAEAVLKMAPRYRDNWDYGNAIHHGNLVLGRVELFKGNVSGAKDYLAKAGNSRGSPQLDTFGPNMTLARELLVKGERAAVLEYFNLVKYFWEKEFSGPLLSQWTEEIEAGAIPNFGGNLKY